MKIRNIIYADEGKVLTNGTDYGKQIFLADGASADAYHEITEDEYRAILKEKEEALHENAGNA